MDVPHCWRRLFAALLTTLLVGLSASTANAAKRGDEKKAARALTAGVEQYNRGHYKEAVKQFTRSYELSPRPIALFHLGRCHEALGDCSTAIRFFERFLKTPGTKESRVAEELMTKCAAALAAQAPVSGTVDRPRAATGAPEEKINAAAASVAATSSSDVADTETATGAASIFPPPAAASSDNRVVDLATAVGDPDSTGDTLWYHATWVWTLVGSLVAAGAGAAAITVH